MTKKIAISGYLGQCTKKVDPETGVEYFEIDDFDLKSVSLVMMPDASPSEIREMVRKSKIVD